MRLLVFFILLTSIMSDASDNKLESESLSLYEKVFPNLTNIIEKSIPDTISTNPVNNKILKAYRGEKFVGYIRHIDTSTGCNSACLPVSYISFYDVQGNFLKILSKSGLTKINHAPFTVEDYSQLELLLSLNPIEFSKIKHPKELTDAISGATLKEYIPIVVKGAAYSTLRIHLYNLNTKRLIKTLK